MHRVILNAPKGMEVDHINRDGLDNRKVNLRLATTTQNVCNRYWRSKTSKYKGVHFDKSCGKYRTEITLNRKRIHVGKYDSEIEAAKAYDNAAKKYHGEFAYLNFKD
jgi:hypothetical protein